MSKHEPKVAHLAAAGVIVAIETLLRRPKGTTKPEATAVLARMFPDRDADGMASTFQTQLGRLPGKTKTKLTKNPDAKRGTVYRLK